MFLKNQNRIAAIVIASLLIAFQSDAADQVPDKIIDTVIAKTGPYLVISCIEGDTGITLLAKVDAGGKRKVIAGDENIAPKIEKLLPRAEAFELIKQMVAVEIKGAGGVKNSQKEADEQVRKSGKGAFNYLTPMQIEAYKACGVNLR